MKTINKFKLLALAALVSGTYAGAHGGHGGHHGGHGGHEGHHGGHEGHHGEHGHHWGHEGHHGGWDHGGYGHGGRYIDGVWYGNNSWLYPWGSQVEVVI